jgi:hypothetical protein
MFASGVSFNPFTGEFRFGPQHGGGGFGGGFGEGFGGFGGGGFGRGFGGGQGQDDDRWQRRQERAAREAERRREEARAQRMEDERLRCGRREGWRKWRRVLVRNLGKDCMTAVCARVDA